MKKIFENAVWWSGVVMAGLILGISLQFVRAWTEPTAAPPDGNVGAPINTGLIGQLKQGALGVSGLLKLYTGLQIPTGAGVGKVLTSDAAGNATWQPSSGGGYSLTYMCYDIQTGGSEYTGTPHCQDSGGTQRFCPAGYTQRESLGKWGFCALPGNGWGTYFFLLVPGGECGSGFGSPVRVGSAYVCSK